ncbi:MAG: VWA domain-containing protein [Deltaproteobacteria bacterium]|nr:VWA domain-containing protein [Deltaproteobacteria bacterium]
MFTEFLYALREQRVPVGLGEWLALHEALQKGLIGGLDDLYGLGRALLVHTEGHFDAYDLAFASTFQGVSDPEVHEALRKWLENPVDPKGLTAEEFEKLTGMSLEELKKRFEETLAEQKERHDGGNRWIGTGGSSPFGSGGTHPTGIRVGEGGGRSAVQIAEERRFRNYRTDAVLDVRQFKQALKMLRALSREGPEILDLDGTIDRTCKEGGDITLEFHKDRKNTLRLMLLMDAGGSMSPYARLVDRLFTAASETSHWKEFNHYFFHNVPYSRLYTNIARLDSVPTEKAVRDHHPDTKVIFVGDACMATWELMAAGGAIALFQQNVVSGYEWVQRFKRAYPNAIWLNPEPERYWNHETIRAIGQVIPMFPLTLDGMRDGIKLLRRGQVR